jgi:hypothetical protein
VNSNAGQSGEDKLLRNILIGAIIENGGAFGAASILGSYHKGVKQWDLLYSA